MVQDCYIMAGVLDRSVRRIQSVDKVEVTAHIQTVTPIMLVAKILSALALSLGSLTFAEAKLKYVGINVSSGEFGVYSPGNPGFGLPGKFGDDYQFIDRHAIDTQLSQGINLFRLSFLVERMCPLEYGLGPKFNETVSIIVVTI